MAFDITTVAGQGTENLDTGSKMPLIRLLQDLSPQIKKSKDEYIEGAETGDLVYAPTDTILEQPAEFIPCYTQSVYTEWVPRDQGGGIVGTHPLSIVGHRDYKKGVKRQYDEWLGDNELKYTTYYFILIKVDGKWEKAVIPFTSSQLTVARRLTQSISKFRYEGMDINPPIYAQAWKLSSVVETSKSGNDYFNFKVDDPRVLDFESDEEVLNLASETHKAGSETLVLTENKPSQPALVADECVPY